MYIFEDREPVVGDIVLWTACSEDNPYIKPYQPFQVLDIDNDNVLINSNNGFKTLMGNGCRKIIKTLPGTEAKVGDTCINTSVLYTDFKSGEVFTVIEAEGEWLKTTGSKLYPNVPRYILKKDVTILCKERTTLKDTHDDILDTQRYFNQNELRLTIRKYDLYKLKTILPKKENLMKYFKVFNKDKTVNIKGLIYQAHKFDNCDQRPFVQDLIKEELGIITTLIKEVDFDKKYKEYTKTFDLELLGLINKLKLAQETLAHKEYKQSIYYELKAAVRYYKAHKLWQQKREFKWIEKYLTHYIINVKSSITLFQSTKIKIYIKEGEIIYRTKNGTMYKLPIRYNKQKDKFHL